MYRSFKGPMEAAFVSLAHSERDIDETVRAAAEAFGELRDPA